MKNLPIYPQRYPSIFIKNPNIFHSSIVIKNSISFIYSIKSKFRIGKFSKISFLDLISRAATAALVEKQSSEMLELINEARSEYMRQESLYLDEGDGYAQEAPPLPYPSRAPPPQPPALAKYHIYNDPLEFADMDQIAISVSPPL